MHLTRNRDMSRDGFTERTITSRILIQKSCYWHPSRLADNQPRPYLIRKDIQGWRLRQKWTRQFVSIRWLVCRHLRLGALREQWLGWLQARGLSCLRSI